MNFTSDWLSKAEELAGNFFHVVDLNKFRDSVLSFRDAVRAYYPNTSFAFSYKIKYLPF